MIKKDVFSINRTYMLESTSTNQPYIDERGASLFFLREEDAKKKAEDLPDVRISGPKFYTLEAVSTLCYRAGASSMCLTVGGEEKVFKLRETDLKLGFYNHQLAQAAALLKQTGLTRYLYALSLSIYIVPAKIKKDGDSITIAYCAVRHTVEKDMVLYLAFANLEEYMIWSTDVKGWSPLLVSYKKLRRLCGKEGLILNPGGNRIILTPDLLKKIDQHITQTQTKTGTEKQKKGEEET